MTRSPHRYHSLLIALHWIMALCIIGMLAGGLLMTSNMLEKSLRFQVYQWHKSLGVILLWLICVRIAVRLAAKKPSLPASMKRWEKIAAKAGHVGLYAIMIIMPFSGWLLVSSSKLGLPTIVFGWFEWPHFPDVAGNHTVHELAEELHENVAWIAIAIITLHVFAVLKHAVIDRENLLVRMGVGKEKI
jgi:cytochrome b561